MKQFVIILLCLFAASCTHRDHSPVAALPADVTIVPPDPSIPAAIARYSGTWRGAWGGSMEHVMIVESIPTPATAMIIFATGSNTTLGYQPGWRRGSARFEDGKLIYESTTSSVTTQYIVQSNGTLAATYRNPPMGLYGQATMTKVSN